MNLSGEILCTLLIIGLYDMMYGLYGMQAGAGAKMLKVDLTEAGVAYENDFGKADYHSLRPNFCTMLAKNGVQPQVA